MFYLSSNDKDQTGRTCFSLRVNLASRVMITTQGWKPDHKSVLLSGVYVVVMMSITRQAFFKSSNKQRCLI